MPAPIHPLENATKNTTGLQGHSDASHRILLSSVTGVFLMCIYITVYVTSTIGNLLVLSVCFSTGRKPRRLSVFEAISNSSPAFFTRYIASLSIADLIFTQLTLLDVVYAIQGEWATGQVVCKLQGFLLETCYSASILTLIAISRERSRSVTSVEMKSLLQRDRERKLFTMGAWVCAFLLCSPLLYGYSTLTTTGGRIHCTNRAWGNMGRHIYYSLTMVILFVFPLLIMIITHVKIKRAFRTQVVPNDSMIASIRRKQRKATRMLGMVTLSFFLCWSPFLVVRTLRYSHWYEGEMAWKLSQLIAASSAAVNPFIYGTYNANFRAHLKKVIAARFCCWIHNPFGAEEASTIPSVSHGLTPNLPDCYEEENTTSQKSDCQNPIHLVELGEAPRLSSNLL